MTMRLLPALPVLLVAFAGCVGEGPASALDLLPDARQAAQHWAEDPVLVSVEGFEPLREHEDEASGIRVHLDPRPGDGRAPAWVYTFQGAERRVFVAVSPGLGVVAEGWQAAPEGSHAGPHAGPHAGRGPAPLPRGLIDSTRVAEVLVEAGWPDGAADASYWWSLRVEEEGPVWTVRLDQPDGGRTARVHAADGTLLGSREKGEGMAAGWTQTRDSGLLTPLEPLVMDGTMEEDGTVWAAGAAGVGVGEVHMRIEGPGHVLYEGRLDGMPAEPMPASAGDHRLTASVGAGARHVAFSVEGRWG